MSKNRFEELTDEMFEFYISCRKSGFSEEQSTALTEKVYAVTLSIRQLQDNRLSKRDIMRRAEILNKARREQNETKEEN